MARQIRWTMNDRLAVTIGAAVAFAARHGRPCYVYQCDDGWAYDLGVFREPGMRLRWEVRPSGDVLIAAAVPGLIAA